MPSKSVSASSSVLPLATQYSQSALYQSTSPASMAIRPFHFGSASSSQEAGSSPFGTRSVFQLTTKVLKRDAV